MDKRLEKLRKAEWLLIPIVLIIGSFFGGTYYGREKALASLEVQRDTITKIVSVYKEFPEPQKTAIVGRIPVPLYRFITDTIKAVDTLVLHDTTVVYLPREQRYYSEAEGALRIWISGYDPRLDRYEFDRPETTITTTMKEKPPRWGISIGGGYGFALDSEKRLIASPYIGLGLTYTILRL